MKHFFFSISWLLLTSSVSAENVDFDDYVERQSLFATEPPGSEDLALDTLWTREGDSHQAVYLKNSRGRLVMKKLMQKIKVTIYKDTDFRKADAIVGDLS